MNDLILAYDQGFEHGPVDFSRANVNPQYIIDIAQKAGVFTGLVLHEGLGAKYYQNVPNLPPLIIKLNGKTSFHKDEEPYSPQLCTVAKAIELGAKSVGYTIFVGSEHEAKMMQEFSLIEDEAHAKGLKVIAWMYPRGKHVQGKENSREVVAYAARLGLELNADCIKLPYTGDPTSFAWVVECAGRTKVLAQGGAKQDETTFLSEVKNIMQAGATGMAVGRNIWQAENPVELSKKIADIIFT